MSVLVIAPHPDDAEIGMGGTLASLISEGVPVSVLDLTNGEPTPHGSPEIRAAEAAAADRILGVTSRRILGLPNREITDSIENRKRLAGVLRELKPEVIFIPYWEDAHPDHVAASALCEAARFYGKFSKTDIPGEPHYVRKVLHFFSTHLKVKMNPSFIVDISKQIDKKIQSIEAYHSQFKANPANGKRIEEIKSEARYWGSQIGVEYGEPFVSRDHLAIKNAKVITEL